MTRVLLLGVSPPAMAALARLGVGYDLVSRPEEAGRLDALDTTGMRRVRVGDYRDPAALALLPLPFADFARVVSFTEYGLFPAAVMNAALGIDPAGLPPAHRTRNKAAMRWALDRAGLPSARHGYGQPPGDLDSVVAKPVGGVSSVGVRRVDRTDFAGLGADDYWEEYLPGREFSVEAVTADGEHHIIGVTAKATTGAPGYIEVGHLFPAPLTSHARAAVDRYVAETLTALGVASGASHTEIRLGDDDRPRIIETHTRPGGDNIPRLAALAFGVDQYEWALRADLHLPPGEPVPVVAPDGAASVYGIGEVPLDDLVAGPGLTVIDRRDLTADGEGSDARTANAVVTGDRPSLLALMDRLQQRFTTAAGR